MNPITLTVGASNYKAEIEKFTSADHSTDVVLFNTWFNTTRSNIIKEEGMGYNKYLGQLFHTYLTCANAEINMATNGRKNRQGLQIYGADGTGELGYINLVDNIIWKGKV